MNKYVSGTSVRSVASFRDFNGNLANTTASMKYRAGTGTTQIVSSPINDSVGVYHFDIDTSGWSGPGDLLYACQWQGAGNVAVIDTDYFEVEPPTL